MIIHRLIRGYPAGINAFQCAVRAVRHQLVPAFQRRHHRAHLVTQCLQTGSDGVFRLALADHAADGTKFRFHLGAFLRRNIDANWPFQILEDLKIGHLNLFLGLINLVRLIELVGSIQPRGDVFGKSTIILGKDRQTAKKKQGSDKVADGAHWDSTP